MTRWHRGEPERRVVTPYCLVPWPLDDNERELLAEVLDPNRPEPLTTARVAADPNFRTLLEAYVRRAAVATSGDEP